jgi:hypothetical protein
MLKGTRWILLKNSANLDESKGEPERLKRALEVNEPLMKRAHRKIAFIVDMNGLRAIGALGKQ